MKAYTDILQSKRLAEILPLESADMTLPFRHPKNNEYIPGYAVSRNYIEAYNEMLLLQAMDKDTVCKLMQPCWSLAALLNVMPKEIVYNGNIVFLEFHIWETSLEYTNDGGYTLHATESYDNHVDACVEMILKLHELNLL